MPINTDSLNRELYGLLKSRGYRPDMFTSSGKKVAIPDEAEVFQFDFIQDDVEYGKVTVTVDGLHRMIVYYGDDVESAPKASSHDSESFTHLLGHLKRFAKNRQLGFELSDQDDLEPDMAKREHNKREGLREGYYPMGKKSSYSDNVPTTKIILQHSRQIEEGEQRYRNIAKIFVENANGERFLVPTTKPGIARVYARHIAEGGTPYDERGGHITSLVEEYSKMAGFVRATRGQQFNESTQKLVAEGINHYQKLRETLHKMSGKKGYTAYFESYTPALMEDEDVDLSEMFMQSSLDPRIESVMPILGKLSKNITESDISEVKELEEWADNLMDGKMSSLASFEKVDTDRDEDDEDEEVDVQDYQDPEEADYGDEYQDTVKRAGDAVKRIEKKLGKVDLGALAKKLSREETTENIDSDQRKAGQLGPTNKVSTGPVLGNKPQSQKGLRGKLVAEDPLSKIKKLSGL
jgi:hypothetical protein